MALVLGRLRACGMSLADYALLFVYSGTSLSPFRSFAEHRASAVPGHGVAIAEDGAFFEAVTETGAHAASLRSVASGDTDIAAIDTVGVAFLAQREPDTLRAVRTPGWTEAAPGLPLVTARRTPDRVVRILPDVAQDAALDEVRRALLLDGFDIPRPTRYGTIFGIEARAVRCGYPLLA